ncbi:MAG TPA: hypothetical protein VJT83_04505 [Chitinophagaceae bacterium]|nr:hypothetical protein [Chitinophagaceae bacterium]
MIKKQTIANLIFTICLFYIMMPWITAKYFFFNELISVMGLMMLMYKRFRITYDVISISMVLLILWGGVHAITSLPRMDSVYYYLRNLVIVYSMMAFFLGYFLFPYLGNFIRKVRKILRVYIGIFIFIRLPRLIFERFGMATIFPALFKKAGWKWLPFMLIAMNLIYGFAYDSFTVILLAIFYFLLFISPGYKFFMQTVTVAFLVFTIVFIYLQPNLSLIANRYDPRTEVGIYDVIRSHPILSIDGNSTWRLVLWKQLIVDNFPGNIFGVGFGTPALKYYPVEDYNKVSSLPYVLGAHNSFVYLFGRLGIVYILLTLAIYLNIFREYYYHKKYYYANNQALVFLSFFAVTMIALFNPALESPVYASGFWLVLGFTARCIADRKRTAVA